MPSIGKRFRRTVVATGAALALGVGAIAALGPTPGGASSHREAPYVSTDPQVDSTDLYAFVSPDKPNTVTIISNWIPFEEPAGGPNFYFFAPNVNYDIRIDNDGDAVGDITYRWVFSSHRRNPGTFLYNTGPVTSLDDTDLNFYQTYDLYRIENGVTKTLVEDALVAPSDVGNASMPDYASLSKDAVIGCGTDCQTWAGQADDPFFLDLRVFDLLYGGDFSEAGDDTLAGFNVNSFAIQVPKTDLALNGNASHNPLIGIWTTAQRHKTTVLVDGSRESSGPFVQVSRLGNPLVNEVVVPASLKNHFNASRPVNDEQYLGAVQDPELPHLINAVYGIPVPDSDPDTPGIQRSDLLSVFLGVGNPDIKDPSEQLRLDMSVPPCTEGQECFSRMGGVGGDAAGYPNGRRLQDDVIDIAIQVMEGVLLPNHPQAVESLGDGVNHNDAPFLTQFPYLALPTPGSAATPHPPAASKA